MKILYLMHVDWNWIKQRPHFIAEELSNSFEIVVLYLYSFNRKNLTKTEKNNSIKAFPFYRIPKSGKIRVLRKIEIFLQKHKIEKLVKKFDIDCIYVPYPSFVEVLPKWFKGKVIYDCMDRYSAFKTDINKQNLVKEQEQKLVERADFIFVSSKDLSSHISQNYLRNNISKNISIVRNAYNSKIIDMQRQIPSKKEELIICYFGTISSWFDFDLIKKSLETFDFIRYRIIGPAEVELPKHPRIEYIGPVKHDKLYETTCDVDLFIMPFVLNDLIRSVDPVKLYEYINFNKNILCIEYDEVERFAPFVHFYKNFDDYKTVILQCKEDNSLKYSQDERIKFLKENTWHERCEYIKNILNAL